MSSRICGPRCPPLPAQRATRPPNPIRPSREGEVLRPSRLPSLPLQAHRASADVRDRRRWLGDIPAPWPCAFLFLRAASSLFQNLSQSPPPLEGSRVRAPWPFPYPLPHKNAGGRRAPPDRKSV